MGYCSDVAIWLSKPLMRHIMKHEFPLHVLQYGLSNSPFCRADNIIETEDGFIVSFSWIKWYEDDEDVAFWEQIVHGARRGEYDSDCDAAMIRIGEDYDDLEIVGDPYKADIYVKREIDLSDVIPVRKNLSVEDLCAWVKSGSDQEVLTLSGGDGYD